MKLILREDVENLGKGGELVEVKPGYGRNFLLPRGLAVPATERDVARIEHEKRVISARTAKLAKEAQIEKRNGDNEAVKIQQGEQLSHELTRQGKLPPVGWENIVEHIDHVVKLVGVNHVGLGSDFDGAVMPQGMEDCSKLPQLTEALLRKGYLESDIRKILGENTLRVMAEAERVSKEMRKEEQEKSRKAKNLQARKAATY